MQDVIFMGYQTKFVGTYVTLEDKGDRYVVGRYRWNGSVIWISYYDTYEEALGLFREVRRERNYYTLEQRNVLLKCGRLALSA